MVKFILLALSCYDLLMSQQTKNKLKKAPPQVTAVLWHKHARIPVPFVSVHVFTASFTNITFGTHWLQRWIPWKRRMTLPK